jgi:hypothetical protein
MREVENLNAIYETILYTMWDPQHLTTLYPHHGLLRG